MSKSVKNLRYGDVLRQLIINDDRIFILTAESMGPIYYIKDDVINNYVDVGISEQTMIGMAVGLALRKRIPVVHAMAAFLIMRSFEFLRTDIGIMKFPVKFVGSHAGFLSSANGPTHQAIEDIALCRSIPSVGIFCPADEKDMVLGLEDVIKSSQPFYIRYNDVAPHDGVHHMPFKMGEAEVFGSGKDLAIITYGLMFTESYKAMCKLEKEGISTRLINLRTLKPLDEKIVIDACTKCDLIVTIEDHLETGGIFSIISEIVIKNRLKTNIKTIGLSNCFSPGILNEVFGHEGFLASQICEKIKAWNFVGSNLKK